MLPTTEKAVSVCMITYKHEKFISQAIVSILDQEVSFDFELVIFDDNSPDNTELIVGEIMTQHPKGALIKYFKNTLNIGVMPNFQNALLTCQGQYIALCEGDDYWIDNKKLQLQVDALENNSDCSFAFHKAHKITDFNTYDPDLFFPNKVLKQKLDEKEFFEIGGKATSSILFRNNISYDFLDMGHSHGDFLLYLKLLEKGKALFIDKVMSIYRIHSGGISFGKGSFEYLKKRIRELEREIVYFTSPKIKNEIRKQKIKHVYLFLKSNYKVLPKKELMHYILKVAASSDFYIYLSNDMIRLTKKRFGQNVEVE